MGSWFEDVIRGSFLEKLAIRETGRMEALSVLPKGRVVVYPESLTLKDLIYRAKPSQEKQSVYFALPGRGTARLVQLVKKIRHLSLRVELYREMELYILSDDDIGLLAWAALVLARLKGRRVTLHDYRFVSDSRRSRGLPFSLANRRIVGDASAIGSDKIRLTVDAVRLFDCEYSDVYRDFAKERAVPDVLVYGDFEKGPALSLTRRAHDMVKEKYPRTIFTLISLRNESVPRLEGLSLRSVTIASEADLKSLYVDADILVLLSPGGVNRHFAGRARAAGFPVIANGFDPFSSGGADKDIIVPRDSYSAVAGEIIRLVDDEAYYRTFA